LTAPAPGWPAQIAAGAEESGKGVRAKTTADKHRPSRSSTLNKIEQDASFSATRPIAFLHPAGVKHCFCDAQWRSLAILGNLWRSLAFYGEDWRETA
jgi:hypothetical protein